MQPARLELATAQWHRHAAIGKHQHDAIRWCRDIAFGRYQHVAIGLDQRQHEFDQPDIALGLFAEQVRPRP